MDVSPEQLTGLLNRLRIARFKVGPAQLLDACAVVDHLRRSGRLPADASVLAGYLAPIFCSTEEQQQTFEDHLRLEFDAAQLEPPILERRAARPTTGATAVLRTVWPLLLALALLVAGAAATWYALHEYDVVVRITAGGEPANGAQVLLSSDDSNRIAIDGQTTLKVNRLALRQSASIQVRLAGFQVAKRDIQALPAEPLQIALEPVPPPSPPPAPKAPAGFERVHASVPQPVAPHVQVQTERLAWSPSRLAALALPPLVALTWTLFWTVRRRAWLARLPERTPRKLRQLAAAARHSLSIALDAGRSAHELRRRRWQPSAELNLEASLRNALDHAGEPRLVFGSRVEPDYLVLIDESSELDHLARLADELMVTLQARDVSLKRFYFRGSPLRCDGPAPERQLRGPDLPSVSLAHLQGSFQAHRLIIVSDGRPLFDAGTGRPLSCVDALLQWHEPVLLTPTRQDSWGRREWALSRLGFVVLPLSGDGLSMLGELHGSDKPVDAPSAGAAGIGAPRWVREPHAMLLPIPPGGLVLGTFCDDLFKHLGADAYLWLQSCAVYPEIHWSMTLRIGAGLLRDDRRLARALTPLVRLPWLRESYMPDWLRDALRERMDADGWHRVHALLRAILNGAEEGGSGDLPLRIATGPRRRRAGATTSRANEPEGRRIRRDAVFLRFMQGPPKLAVPAADRIRRIFFKEGLWSMGLRAGPLALIAVLASAAIAAQWWPRVDVPQVEDRPGERPAVSALAVAGSGSAATAFVGYDNGEVWHVSANAQRRFAATGPAPVQGFAAAEPNRVLARLGGATTVEIMAAEDGAAGTATPLPMPVAGDQPVIGAGKNERAFLSANGMSVVFGSGAGARRFNTNHTAAPACMAFMANGTFVTVAAGVLRLFDPQRGEFNRQELKMDAGCAAPPGGRAIFVWDRAPGAAPVIQRFEMKERRLTSPMALSSRDPIADVAASADGTIVWVRRGDQVTAYDGDTREVLGDVPVRARRIATSIDGSRLALVTPEGRVEMWSRGPPGGKEGAQPGGQPREIVAGLTLRGHSGPVHGVTFSPDGARIVSGSNDETLRVWDAKTGAPIGMPLRGHTAAVLSVAFSPDGSRIVSGSSDRTLRLWDGNSGRPVGAALRGHTWEVWNAAFSPDGLLIASVGRDGTLRRWDARTGKATGEPSPEGAEIYSVAFSPIGDLIITGDEAGAVRRWESGTGRQVGNPLLGHSETVYGVAYSGDGSRIVSGSKDGTLQLWNARTGARVGTQLRGHTGPVSSVAFSPDKSRIVSGSWDNTLRLWDARTGTPIGQPLRGHTDLVRSVAFSPDGSRIVSGSDDRTLRVWNVGQAAARSRPVPDNVETGVGSDASASSYYTLVAAVARDLLAGTSTERQLRSILGSVSLTDAANWAGCTKNVLRQDSDLVYASGRFAECGKFETSTGIAEMIDFVRRNPKSRQYFYASIPIQRGGYARSAAGAAADDIVGVTQATIDVLSGRPATAPVSIRGKREALLLLLQLVAEIHRPLHVAEIFLDSGGKLVDPDLTPASQLRGTNGANLIGVVEGDHLNFHATWDAMPAELIRWGPDRALLETARRAPRAAGDARDWPVIWAGESLASAKSMIAGLDFQPAGNGRFTVTLTPDYRMKMGVIKAAQVASAGNHLAQLLMAILP